MLPFSLLKQTMQMLRLVLHNTANRPIYIEVAIDEAIKKAIQFSKVTKVDFLIYEVNKEHQIIVPDKKLILPNKVKETGQLNNFKEL